MKEARDLVCNEVLTTNCDPQSSDLLYEATISSQAVEVSQYVIHTMQLTGCGTLNALRQCPVATLRNTAEDSPAENKRQHLTMWKLINETTA